SARLFSVPAQITPYSLFPQKVLIFSRNRKVVCQKYRIKNELFEAKNRQNNKISAFLGLNFRKVWITISLAKSEVVWC
ncbi:MAG: hypothetical protein IJ751_04885, partial [Oscillospiraceae bacterium]|nr:hypothetical protein [Oscillospiraceae bacterium]